MGKHRAPDNSVVSAVALTAILSTSGVGLIAPVGHAEGIPEVLSTAPGIHAQLVSELDVDEEDDPPAERAVATKTTAPAAAERSSNPAPKASGVAGLLASQPSSGFNGVKAHVARAGHLVQDRFGVKTVYGVAGRANVSDHPLGLALDFMVDRETGDQVAAFFLAHKDLLKVEYVIWRQRINHGSGWSLMEDRGGITANHYDHVHVSFKR